MSAVGGWLPRALPVRSTAYRTRARSRPTDHRPAASTSPAATSPSPRRWALRLLFFRSVFGSFPSVASAGLRLQRRWPGVKFALYKPQLAGLTAAARTLLPDAGAVPIGLTTRPRGTDRNHLRNRRRRALTGPPYGTAPVPRGSREPPPEAPAVDFRHPPRTTATRQHNVCGSDSDPRAPPAQPAAAHAHRVAQRTASRSVISQY